MTQPTISAERIEEMLAGLEGVTPGPWKYEGSIYEHMGAGLRSIPDDHGFAQLWKSDHVAIDAKHLARCDPDTMREVLTLALSALRAQAQVSEAVAWEIEQHHLDGNSGSGLTRMPRVAEIWRDQGKVVRPLYASPPVQAQPRGVMKWDGHPTPSEAAELLRAYARKKRLPPSDNNFEDAAGIIDTLSALATPPAPVDVTDDMVEAIATLYGNYIPSHGWTGFGPTPEQIAAALTASRAAVAQDETP